MISLIKIIFKVNNEGIKQNFSDELCELLEAFNLTSLNIPSLILYLRLLKEVFESSSNNDAFPFKLILPGVKILIKKTMSFNTFSLFNDKNEKENMLLADIYAFFIQYASSAFRILQIMNEQQTFDDLAIQMERIYEILKIDKFDKESLNIYTEKIKEALFKYLPNVK